MEPDTMDQKELMDSCSVYITWKLCKIVKMIRVVWLSSYLYTAVFESL